MAVARHPLARVAPPAPAIISGWAGAVALPRAGLFHAEFFGVPVEHEAFTGEELNFQHTSVAVVSLLRDALDKRVTFKHCAPYGREVISVPHQFGALLREIA